MPKQSQVKFVLLLTLLLATPVTVLGQVKKVDELKYPPLPAFEIPKPTRVVLDNGMVLMLIEDHELGLVSATAMIHTGSCFDPADKAGLASLTGTVMRTGGTTSMAADALDDYLEGKAATVEVSIGTDSGHASMNCLKEDFPDVLKVLNDVLRRPAFDAEKLAIAKNQMNAVISRQNDDPQGILFREFDEIIYGADSPYVQDPTYASVSAISRDDLVGFHDKYFQPNRIVLGLVGDFDTRQAVDLVKQVFGDWPKGPAIEKTEIPYRKDVKPGVYYVEKDDMNQSDIMMGHLGIVRDNPDYYAVQVLNQVLSGAMSSRLFSSIRTKQGLAYSVSGGIGSEWDHHGTFDMWMTTKTGNTGRAISALIAEARKLTSDPPSAEELKRAKNSILNSFIFNSDSNAKILRQQLTYEYYGYPLDWLSKYREGIEKATLEEVRAAAVKYVHPDQLAILVVGPKQGMDRPLSDFGPLSNVDITIPEPEAPKVEGSADAVRKGDQLIAKALEGMGGADKVDAVKTMAMKASTVAHTPRGDMDIQMEMFIAYPDRYRQQITLPFGKMTTVYTPQDSFAITPQGQVQTVPDSQRGELEKFFLHQQLALLKARNQDGFKAIALASAELDGRQVEQLHVEWKGESETLSIDPQSGRILAIAYRGTNMTGAPGEMMQKFSDFREVDGITIPFQSETLFNNEAQLTATMSEATFNASVDEAQFARPEGK